MQKEANAVKEAKRLNIPVFAMVDTCCDPTDIDYVIPANDDAAKSIAVVLEAVTAAIGEGLAERKLEKEKEAAEAPKKEEKEAKPRIRKGRQGRVRQGGGPCRGSQGGSSRLGGQGRARNR